MRGFVVAVGKRWALLHRIMEGGYFDGHVAIRLIEIARVREVDGFESRFARTQPEWPPAPPPGTGTIDLDTTFHALASLTQHGCLFGIERNKKFDAIWIGVPDELTRKWLYMREVRPDATWHEVPLSYRLRTITMVALDDHYQRALAVIAGPPPTDSSASTRGDVAPSQRHR